jgi:aconitate hydratase
MGIAACASPIQCVVAFKFSNCSPLATCGFFPIDKLALDYMQLTGRDPHRISLVEANCRAQGLFCDSNIAEPVFPDTLDLDLSAVEPSLAGPKRPHDRVSLKSASAAFKAGLAKDLCVAPTEVARTVPIAGLSYQIGHG